MIPPTTAYRDALEEARKRAFTIRAAGHRSLLNSFSDALVRLAELETSSNPITADRASSLKEQINNLLSELNSQVASGVSKSVDLTVQDLVRIHEKVNNKILTQFAPGLAMRVGFSHLPVQVLGVIAARNGNAANFRSLLNHRFSATIEQVDTLIDSAVARGVSSGTLTRDLALMLSDHSLAGVIPSSSRLHRGELGNIEWSRYGIDPALIPQARKILYDSRRIAVSENMNAMREANAHALVASPLAKTAQWQTNSRHEKIDECDVLARSSFYEGLPLGYYPVEKWPRAPHPFCGCYQGNVLLRPAKEWGTPKKPEPWKRLPEPQLNSELRGKVRDRVLENAIASTNVSTIKVSTSGPTKATAKVSPVKAKKPPPKPPAPNPNIPGPPPRMTKTQEQIDDDIRKVLNQPSSSVSTPQQLAEQIGEAMDAQAWGHNTFTQRSIASQRRMDLWDKGLDAKAGVLGTAHWEGHISFNSTTSDGLARFRAEWYIKGDVGGREGASAFQTLIHELEHMRSPTQYTGRSADALSYGATRGSRYLEEGIVEYKARNRVGRLLFETGNWREIPEFAMKRSYPEFTNGVTWYADTFGEAALEEVWQGTNGSIRVERAAKKIRAYLDNEVNKMTASIVRGNAQKILARTSDEDLVNSMHKLALIPRGMNDRGLLRELNRALNGI